MSNHLKMVQHAELYLQWLTNRKLHMIYQLVPFSVTLNDPSFSFKVAPFFDAEYLINGPFDIQTDIVSMKKLIGTYTRPTQQCHFEWSWVTLSHLAQYSVTRSIILSLCDSRTTCQRSLSDVSCKSALSHIDHVWSMHWYIHWLKHCDRCSEPVKQFTASQQAICSRQLYTQRHH